MPRPRPLARSGATRPVRVAALVVALAAPAPLLAQPAADPVVAGTVRAEGGAPVPGAQVTLQDAAGAVLASGLATADGTFAVAAPRPGTYVLRVARVGFAPASRELALVAQDTARVELVLAVRAAVLEGVTVSGQRRRTASATRVDTELLDIPQAIQVIGQDVLRQQAVIDMKDALRNVSSVTYTGTYNGGYQYYSSRGFWMSNVGNFRRNGLMLPNFGQNYADNVESVEVLKGPAGILFGDVAPGGIVNVTTKQPLSSPYRRLEVRTGSHGLVRPSVDVTGPLNDAATLRGRLNASYERAGSFRDEVSSDAVLVAPALAWDAGARTRVSVEGSWRQDDRVGDPGLISPDGSVAGLRRLPISRFLGEPTATYGYVDRAATATVEHDVRDGWRLRGVGGWNFQTRTPLNIYLDQAAPDGSVTRDQYFFHQERRQRSAALDLLGTVRTGAVEHALLVGADWMTHTSHTGRFVEAPIPGSVDLFAPRYGEAELQPAPSTMDDGELLTRRVGLYAQDQVGLLDGRVQLLLGVRLNDFTSGMRYDDPADRPEGERDTRERPVSPRLGAVVKPLPWLSTYASYAESYEVNGFDWIDPSVAIAPTFGRQWEVGLKGDLLDRRLGVTVAAFRLRKEDVYGWADYSEANPAPTPEDAERGWFTYSGATHASRGLELDVNGRLTDRLTVVGAAAYTETEIVEDPAYASGNWLANTPRETANLWVNWRPARVDGLDLSGGVFYKGRFYGSEDNAPEGLVPANHTIDLGAGYTWRGYRAQLNVTNVTDRVSYLGGFGVWEPQWPRRVVLSLAAEF